MASEERVNSGALGAVFLCSCIFLVIAYAVIEGAQEGSSTVVANGWFIAACGALAFAAGMALLYIKQEWPVFRWIIGATILMTFLGVKFETLDDRGMATAEYLAAEEGISIDEAVEVQEMVLFHAPAFTVGLNILRCGICWIIGAGVGWVARFVAKI